MSLSRRPERGSFKNLVGVGYTFYSNIPGEEFSRIVDRPMEVVSLFIDPSLIEETLGVRYSADITVRNFRSLHSAAP
jgi:hypothetical protein